MNKLCVRNVMFGAMVVAGVLTTNVIFLDSSFHLISPFSVLMLVAFLWRGGVVDGLKQSSAFQMPLSIFFQIYCLMMLSGNERPSGICEVNG